MNSYFVYIISNYKNTVLYIGVTNNLQKRIWEHKSGLSENSFSNRYRLYKLVWFQNYNNINEAIEAEKMIKGWRRSKKEELIRENNPNFSEIVSLR